MKARYMMEELYNCIQSHFILRRADKLMEKHDIEDYIIFIRTERNTFLRGSTADRDIPRQLAFLIMNAADDIGLSPEELVKEIEIKVYKEKLLRAQLQEIAENPTLSQDERVQAIREAYKEAEYTDIEIDRKI